ncbi:putative RiPP precursor [uncultured Propionibacterium sp.]|nr:putative RiPP precursor [uncultured Propionibacterium sp.]
MAKIYTTPTVTTIGTFRGSTRGVWFGKCRDVFGGHAFICIG